MRPEWRAVTMDQECFCAWCDGCAASAMHADGCSRAGLDGARVVLTTTRACAENGLVPGAAVLAQQLEGLTWQGCENACRVREAARNKHGADALRGAFDKMWDLLARGGPDEPGPQPMCLKLLVERFGEARNDMEAQQAMQNDAADTQVDFGDDRADYKLVVKHVARTHMAPAPSAAETAALLRAVEQAGVAELRRIFAQPAGGPQLGVTRPSATALYRAEDLDKEPDVLIRLGTWCRNNGVAVLPGPGRDSFLPTVDVLRAVRFGFLRENCTKLQLPPVLGVLYPLGLCFKSVLLRDDARFLNFVLSAWLTRTLCDQLCDDDILQRVGTSQVFTVDPGFFDLDADTRIEVSPLGKDGFSSETDYLDGSLIFAFAKSVLAPDAFEAFESDAALGLEIRNQWHERHYPDTKVLCRQPRAGKYFHWLCRAAQDVCACCVHRFASRDSMGFASISQAASDHIVPRGNGVCQALVDWKTNPWKYPHLVSKWCGMRAVHSHVACHAHA